MQQRTDEGSGTGSATACRPAAHTFGFVFPKLMIALFLSSMDQTVIASMLPSIVRDLGGVTEMYWLVIGYMLMATVSAPVSGRLGDLYGRRIVLIGAAEAPG